jgi:hypothetical protein
MQPQGVDEIHVDPLPGSALLTSFRDRGTAAHNDELT